MTEEGDASHLMSLRAERKALRDEVQHRVRNLVGRIRAILRRTAETSGDVQDLAQHLEGRLDALARLHLLSSHETEFVDLDRLIADELLVYHASEGARVSLEGPGVRLTCRAAESLGLAVHELATNAVKFGALAVASGHIAISWTVTGDERARRLDLTWRESGGAFVQARGPSGFGTDMLTRTMPDEIGAVTTLDIAASGCLCKISLPNGIWRLSDDG